MPQSHAAYVRIRDWLSWYSRCQLFDQPHVGAGHQLVDVNQDQHALIQGTETDQIVGVEGRAHFRRRLDLLRRQGDYVRHAIDHHADHAAGDVQDDDDGELIVSRFAQLKLDAHVDDRNNDAAQIDDTLDEVRRVRDTGYRFVTTDFLNFQDIDTVFFFAQGKGKEFISCAVGFFAKAGNSFRHVV